MTKLKCLVTGGAGFIGSNLALELEAQGHEVTAIDNLFTGAKENLKSFQGTFLEIDVSHPFEIDGKFDVIFHEAAITNPRFGDDAEMMRPATPDDHREFARIFSRQINTVHKKLRPLPTKSWAGVCCQPFVFGTAEPDWKDTDSLTEKLAGLLRAKKSAMLTTVRILRIFDGPFIFLIKPDRLRYWLRSIALRDADEALADLRGMGF